MYPDMNKNTYLNDARFYDLDPRELLKTDIPFYLKYAAKIGGDILELACGSGRITIPLAEAGHNVWGLEFSETMLEQFRKKMTHLSKKTSTKIQLIQGDMSHFKIPR
ncbi:MAG TPA: class I SAM-dependent methyltransferase, partial [Candidatus Kapabacteria bacterium]|nr:class I SAM-dependent methyltransferase [Candidatus Kapabacteria bacterium]